MPELSRRELETGRGLQNVFLSKRYNLQEVKMIIQYKIYSCGYLMLLSVFELRRPHEEKHSQASPMEWVPLSGSTTQVLGRPNDSHPWPIGERTASASTESK